MKLSLLKENIEYGLAIAERIAPKSHTLPILGNVLLETEKNFLKLSVTDLDIAVNYWVLGKIEKQGKITIPAKLFAESIRFFPEEKIDIEAKQNVLTLSGEKGMMQILGQPPDDFPTIPLPQKEDYFEVNCLPFCEGLSSVIDFVATSSPRVELTGVYMRIHPKGITFVATDSFRLAEKQLFFSQDTEKKLPEKEYTILIPQKFIREFLSFTQERKGKVKIYLSQNQIVLEYQGEDISDPKVQFLSRLLEGEFPNYKEIIPENYNIQALVSKEEFIRLLRTASVMSPKTNEIVLYVSPKKKVIEIESKSPDKGEWKSFLSADCTGDELNISFNWRFLLSGLLHMVGPEVIIGFQDSEKPTVIRPKEDMSYVYVVMPMRSS